MPNLAAARATESTVTGTTSTRACAVRPSTAAVIQACPGWWAITFPDGSTVATVRSLLVQVTPRPSTA